MQIEGIDRLVIGVGYNMAKTSAVMRPSATLNAILKGARAA